MYMDDYFHKYIKYKTKYLNYKNHTARINNAETYYIHDNGGRPFKVVIEKPANKVSIYKVLDCPELLCLPEYSKEKLLEFQAESMFIGKSPLNKMTEFGEGYGPDFDGNSILLHLTGNTYVYIGSSIYMFNAYGKIISYTSPVGNNDVPYPYAIDDAGNIYLLIEDAVIENNDRVRSYGDPYDYYYHDKAVTRKLSNKKVLQERL